MKTHTLSVEGGFFRAYCGYIDKGILRDDEIDEDFEKKISDWRATMKERVGQDISREAAAKILYEALSRMEVSDNGSQIL